jgi:hypothetical protein
MLGVGCCGLDVVGCGLWVDWDDWVDYDNSEFWIISFEILIGFVYRMDSFFLFF